MSDVRGAVLHGPRGVRFEEVPTPKIQKPTDAVLRIAAACVCGSDLWPYRGVQPVTHRPRSATSTAASSRRSGAAASAPTPCWSASARRSR
jgi:NADPH:quinone reductase-like Zn-dependent oxidoreductase